MQDTTIFVVSDDIALRDSACELIEPAGRHVETFASLDQWLAAVAPRRPGCLILDARARDFSGAERLARFTTICASRPVLLLIDRGDVPNAVQALRGGAAHVLEKPCRDRSLLEHLEQMCRERQGHGLDACAAGSSRLRT